MQEVCADFEAELKQFNGEDDHVHLLVHYPPKVTSGPARTSPEAAAGHP